MGPGTAVRRFSSRAMANVAYKKRREAKERAEAQAQAARLSKAKAHTTKMDQRIWRARKDMFAMAHPNPAEATTVALVHLVHGVHHAYVLAAAEATTMSVMVTALCAYYCVAQAAVQSAQDLRQGHLRRACISSHRVQAGRPGHGLCP